jgi:capsid protein
MSNVPPFDPTPILQNRPWFERALEAVAPSYALKRLEAKVQRELFSYNASVTNRIYAPRTYGQPSESTQTTRSRVVMMWEARELVENVPQARAVSRKFGQYLTPHEYSPTTGDKKYNDIVNEYFHDWCKRCDISGRHSFKKLIQLAAEERPVDGDCGFAIRRVEGGLKIQLIPATRIGNPNALGAESDNYFQGVIVDEFGKPVAYRIFRVTREGVYFGAEEISAENFTHYFDPFRIDQYRGITDFHSSSRTIRMLNEILEAEKAGVRFASQQAALVFSDRGTANPRNLFQAGPPNVTLPNGQEQQNEFSQVATIRYFGNADRIELMPSRPSNAFSGFIAHLMHEIAIGTGIPQGVLFGTEDYTGPSVRAEFAAADRVFSRHQGVLQDKVLDPIKNAVLLDAIARQELPPPPLQEGETLVQALKRATKGEWRFPAKLTIDVGRESAANMAENRQGAKSLQEIAASEGTDAFGRLEQIAAEAAYVKELSSKYGVPETAIRLTTQQLPATPVQAASAGANIGEAAAQIDPQQPQETPADQTPTEVSAEQDLATTTGGTAPSSDKAQLIEVNFAADSYRPTAGMASNARRALEVRAAKPPSQRGMTAVGIARARDIQNRKELSPDTVRRMKAYFDRHEIDKKGSTWSEQGKGWQAWMGWGGDEGRTWANAIVERLNKERQQNSTPVENRVEFSAATEVELAIKKNGVSANDWLTAVQQYRKELHERSAPHVEPLIAGKSALDLIEQKKEFVMPTPEKGEKGDDFLSRCMGNPTMVKDYPENAQRYAVCQAQLKERK